MGLIWDSKKKPKQLFKRKFSYLISREDKTDEIKDKTGLKLMKMGI